VGVLPEHYFIYFEDVDWSLRFQQAGWRTVADPGAAIVHYESATMGQNSPIKLYYYVRNNLLFLDAWVPEAQRGAARTRLNVKFAKQAVKSALRRSVPHLRALAGAYADYRAGRTGKTERRL
jgi:GT2 family glycosyltransferase